MFCRLKIHSPFLTAQHSIHNQGSLFFFLIATLGRGRCLSFFFCCWPLLIVKRRHLEILGEDLQDGCPPAAPARARPPSGLCLFSGGSLAVTVTREALNFALPAARILHSQLPSKPSIVRLVPGRLLHLCEATCGRRDDEKKPFMTLCAGPLSDSSHLA